MKSETRQSDRHQVSVPPGTGWKEIYMGGSPEAEARMIEEVMPKMADIQRTVAARQNAKIRRGFHNKGMAIVKIEFQVAEDLHESLRIGFLKPGAKYEGFGRFSRQQSFHNSDKVMDGKGFAFRVFFEGGCQDFLFTNTPVSFAEDPVTFLRGGEIFAKNIKPMIPLKLITTFGLKKGLRILKDVTSPPDISLSFTCQPYWTRVPFQVGESAVVFVVLPGSDTQVKVPPTGPDFLTEHLKSELKSGPKTFDLCAQFFVDESKTPIENANQRWEVSDSPYVRMGKVTILQQDLDSKENAALVEKIESSEAFSPWNTKYFRPLGRTNRARKIVYDLSAQMRGAHVMKRDA